jgi:hypothetical protein
MSLRQGKRKSIVNAEPRLCTNDIASSGDLFPWEVDYFEPTLDQTPLLFEGKAQQFIVEQCVGDEDLKRQAKEYR